MTSDNLEESMKRIESTISQIDNLISSQASGVPLSQANDQIIFGLSQWRTGKLLLYKLISKMEHNELLSLLLTHSIICLKDGLAKVYTLTDIENQVLNIRRYNCTIPEIMSGKNDLFDEAVEEDSVLDFKITEDLYVFLRQDLLHIYK